MSDALDYLHTHWLALTLTGGAAALGVLALLLRRRGLTGWAVALGLLGVGGLLLPSWDIGLILMYVAAGVFTVAFLVLIVSGNWWDPLGYGVGGLFLLGLGGLAAVAVGAWLVDAVLFVASLELIDPWSVLWLLLLLLVPLIVLLSFRSLAGLGPVRRWVALGLRCSLIVFLVLALCNAHARDHDDTRTVIFLWDRSLSMPREYVDGKDVHDERVFKFINESVKERGERRDRDRVGVIVFGRTPRLELPPDVVRDLRFRKIVSTVDETHTDIAAAIKLALASFPEGSGKRIVLVSDGNQNLGDAEEQARIAKQNGVQIDVVPVIADRQRQQEVLVERIEAPPVTEKDSRVPIRIVLRSYNPQVVVGNLTLIKLSMDLFKGGEENKAFFDAQPILQTQVKLRQGLNTFYFQQPGAKHDQSYTYEAKFVPTWVENERGQKLHDRLAQDRLENNRASTNVVARGQRNVLLVESKGGEHKLLLDRLTKAKSSLKLVAVEPGTLPRNPDQLALVLSRFDSVILANVPADELTEDQQKVIRSNTHDQGCGLIMVGGPQGFGSGGWHNTPVEDALPVTCDLKSMKVEGKSGLVLIMHASEIADGNFWQKEIAKLAIQKLSPMDMVGLIYYDWQGGGHKWHVPFQLIGGNRAAILRQLDSMSPGDMPDAAPPLKMAHDALSNPAHALGTKHIIFISDGDHWEEPNSAALRPILLSMKAKKISCTTVCVTSHGANEVAKMKRLSDIVGGKMSNSHHVTDPRKLPEIYIKESRLISQSFIHEKSFQPILRQRGGPTEGLPKDLSPLHGFVRTTVRSSPLVEVPIQTPKLGGYTFPILAYWHYGLGKAVAFTSDARTIEGSKTRYWDHDWANSEMHGKFWEQVVDWSLRAVETGRHLQLATEIRDGKVYVTVEARDDNKQPLTDVDLKAGITSPALKDAAGNKIEVKFEQKNSGVYEAVFKADDIGSYFINVSARWKDAKGNEVNDSVRTGVTIPYSPEFAEMESNPAFLEKLRDITGGKTFADLDSALRDAAKDGEVFRDVPVRSRSLQPIWYWLVVLTAVGLFFDVAVRRITVEPGKLVSAVQGYWDRLRGRAPASKTPQFLDRLQSRKAQVGESLEKAKTKRRFEAGDVPVAAPPPSASALPAKPPPRPTPSAPLAPEKEAEKADYASRLLKAKKRVWKDREQE